MKSVSISLRRGAAFLLLLLAVMPLQGQVKDRKGRSEQLVIVKLVKGPDESGCRINLE